MPANRSFSLGDSLDQFIDAQVQAGRFGNATEVVRAGLRLLQDHETKMEELRRLIDQADESIAQGRGVSYSDPAAAIAAITKKG